MPKNGQTTVQLCSLHIASKGNAQNSPSQASTVNFHMFKLDLEKAEDPEITLPTSAGASKN